MHTHAIKTGIHVRFAEPHNLKLRLDALGMSKSRNALLRGSNFYFFYEKTTSFQPICMQSHDNLPKPKSPLAYILNDCVHIENYWQV